MSQRSIIILALYLFLVVGVATAGDYWPILEGAVYEYVDDRGTTLTITVQDGRFESVYSYGCRVTNWYSDEANGDVLLLSDSNYCQGAIDPDYIWSFDPGVTFIDSPLEVGKSWSAIVTACGYGCQDGYFSYEVSAEETVTVPLGTFDVLVVEERCFLPAGSRWGTYKLNQEIGPIVLPGGYELTKVSGTVPAAATIWGSVKALYR